MKYLAFLLAICTTLMIQSCGASHDEAAETKVEKTEVLNELDELDMLDAAPASTDSAQTDTATAE